eukprot:11432970-Ditylum_brightwellii.AAC.1
MTDTDTFYILVQDLLRGNALTAFNNEQATFDKQSLRKECHGSSGVPKQGLQVLEEVYMPHDAQTQ